VCDNGTRAEVTAGGGRDVVAVSELEPVVPGLRRRAVIIRTSGEEKAAVGLGSPSGCPSGSALDV